MRCTWYDLQQQHKFKAISEVLLNVLNLCPSLPQVGVTPSCEGLRGRRESWLRGRLSDDSTDSRRHTCIYYTYKRKGNNPTFTHTASPLRAGTAVHFSLSSCYESSCWHWKCRDVQWRITLTATVDSTVPNKVDVTSGLMFF